MSEATGGRKFEEGMRRLFQELFTYLRKQVGTKVSDEDLLKMTQEVLARMKKGVGPATWEAAQPAKIQALKKADSLYRAFRIVGSIAELCDPELVRIPDDKGEFFQAESTCMKIRDSESDTIWSLDVVGPEIDAVLELRRRGGLIEFLCMVIDLPIRLDKKRPDQNFGLGRRQFFIHILDVRRSTSTLDLLGASSAERAFAEELLGDLQHDNIHPRDFLFDELAKRLNIMGLADFPELSDLIRFTVLQALSAGRIDHAPARLHGLVVGPPGQGKKLVGLAARILNPVCVELSPSKVSLAGLAGSSHRTADGWVSQPGALALASNGVAALQDAHGWEGADLRRIAPMLQELMEDGVVRDSVAGGQRRTAETSLLIDLNRSSQVTLNDRSAQEAALLRIRPLISRFDCIVEIHANMERTRNVSRQLYSSLQHSTGSLDEEPWVREVKLLVALLRDKSPEVDIEDVRELMAAVHDDVFEQNKSKFEKMPEASDIPARLAISFARLVTAAARGRNSAVAEARDVDVATTFINHKLNFLRVHGTSYPTSVTGTSSPQGRADWTAKYAGKEVRTQDVVNDFKKETGQGMSERTARRHLQRLGGLRTAKGHYLLPSGPTEGAQPDDGLQPGDGPQPDEPPPEGPDPHEPVTAIVPSLASGLLSFGRGPTGMEPSVEKEIARGAVTPFEVPPAVSGMTRPMTVLLAKRKDDLIKWDFHGNKETFCPPIWADFAIGSGACGFGCRRCFLMLTFRAWRDPLRPYVYTNTADFVRAAEKWLSATSWNVNGKGDRPRSSKDSIGLGIDCADSLLWEGVTGHARALIPLFTNPATNPLGNPLILLTKSANVHYLAQLEDHDLRRREGRVPNVVVTMSLNPEAIADLWEGKFPDTLERMTPPIERRLAALRQAQDMGFEVRARIDPILTPPGWQELYKAFFADMANRFGLRPSMLTLGTYREKNAQLDTFREKWGLPAMEWEPTKTPGREGTHVHDATRLTTYAAVRDLIASAYKGTGHTPAVSLCKETHVVRKAASFCNANCNCLQAPVQGSVAPDAG